MTFTGGVSSSFVWQGNSFHFPATITNWPVSLFFQAIIGLERALRLHFAAEKTPSFAKLLGRAVEEETVTDAVFSEVLPLSEWLLKKIAEKVLPGAKLPDFAPLSERLLRKIQRAVPTHSLALSVLVTTLRNEYMHGGYIMASECLHLTIQTREIADALITKKA